MPPYDPKAKRPKLVPVDDDAPVDAILDPTAEPSPAAPAPHEPARSHLSVVPSEPPEPAPPLTVTVEHPSGSASGARTAIAVAVTAAAVLGLIVVWRRRS